jgi:hypothetical protein
VSPACPNYLHDLVLSEELCPEAHLKGKKLLRNANSNLLQAVGTLLGSSSIIALRASVRGWTLYEALPKNLDLVRLTAIHLGECWHWHREDH